MPKKSIIERQKKREKLTKKYFEKRKHLKSLLKNTTILTEKFTLVKKLSKLPRDSSLTRLHNRCWKTGRSRGYYRFFGLCRNVLREFTHQGLLPGVIKSSW